MTLRIMCIIFIIQPFTEGQKPMSRSIVAVEMLTVNKNGILEFKETPAITEVISNTDQNE